MKGAMGRLLKVVLIALLVLVLLAAVVIWHRRANPDPGVAFYQALQYDLTATGLSCTVQVTNGGVTTQQSTDLNLATKSLQTQLTLSQKTSTVTTQEIVSGQADYVRYIAIKTTATNSTGQKQEFSKVLDVWSKDTVARGTTPSVFAQTTLGNCIVPLAHLTSGQAGGFVQQLRKNVVFKTDFTNATRTKLNGTAVLKYQVSVQPESYVAFMKQLAEAYGLSGLSNVNASSFSQKSAENFTFYVTPWPARVLQVTAQGRSYTVTFRNDGVVPKIVVPTTTVTSQVLLQRLSQASE
jgi:hypothetical protein